MNAVIEASADYLRRKGARAEIGAKVVSHGRYVTFQLAEVAVSRQMFADILSLVARLRAPPAPYPADCTHRLRLFTFQKEFRDGPDAASHDNNATAEPA